MQAVPNIPAHYYARIAEILLKSKPEFRQFLKQHQIDLHFLFQPNQRLSIQQVENLVAMALHVAQRADLAIDLGQSLRITSHAIIGYGILTSETIEQAMKFLSRYFKLIMPIFRMNIQTDAKHVNLVFEPTMAMSTSCLQFHLESICAAFNMALIELLNEKMQPYHVYYAFSEPAHAARYQQLKYAKIHFNWEQQPVIRLKFPIEMLSIPLDTADAYSREMIEQRCLEEMQGLVSRGKIGDWVEMMLRESTDGLPQLKELAQLLNISVRTLDRHLKAEQIHFRQLSLKIMCERAQQQLVQDSISIHRIALELGYSDLSNFSRAFKKMTGHSPEQYRQLHATARQSS